MTSKYGNELMRTSLFALAAVALAPAAYAQDTMDHGQMGRDRTNQGAMDHSGMDE